MSQQKMQPVCALSESDLQIANLNRYEFRAVLVLAEKSVGRVHGGMGGMRTMLHVPFTRIF